MRRVIATLALLAGVALVLASSAPASADPGGNNNAPPGKGNPNAADAGRPAGGGGHGAGAGNAGSASGSVGGNASSNDPRGFNGHIKVHDGDREPTPIVRNEPQVGCTLHVHGFDFDRGASGTWSIQSWPPTGDRSTVLSGMWTSDGDGNWRTALLSVSSGHYRVNADQTSPAAPGGEKHKMFWARCEAAPPQQGAEQQQEQQQEEEQAGRQQEQAVLGFEQAPMAPLVSVSPIVEGPAAPAVAAVQPQEAAPQVAAQAAPPVAAQAEAQVAQQQVTPIAMLPSTSAAPSYGLVAALLGGAGIWLLRRMRER
jgi:hypothetical protein